MAGCSIRRDPVQHLRSSPALISLDIIRDSRVCNVRGGLRALSEAFDQPKVVTVEMIAYESESSFDMNRLFEAWTQSESAHLLIESHNDFVDKVPPKHLTIHRYELYSSTPLLALRVVLVRRLASATRLATSRPGPTRCLISRSK